MTIRNGCYTVRNRQTGDHRTFRIATRTWKDGKTHRVLELLTGPSNTDDYLAIGFAGDTPADLRPWRSAMAKAPQVGPLVQSLRAAMDPAHPWHHQLELHLAATCRRCNRLLTTPESIEAGIGPECARLEARV
jgi:hypothetical protein